MERKVNEYLRDFPILQTKMNGRPIVYLDNGATTQKPETVIRAVADYCTYCNANPHRGAYELSIKATDIYERARVRTQQFIGAARPDEIVITISEHHSNIVPWQFVAKSRGAVLKYIYLGEDGNLSEADIAEKITERTKIVAVTQVSNVLGLVNDVRAVADRAHAVGAVVVVDGSQSVPHIKVDVQAMDADFFAFSGHKMLSPMGIGVLYGKYDILDAMPPFLFGGDMIDYVGEQETTFAELPAKFEAGTQNVSGASGLIAAIDYLDKIGFDRIEAIERDLLSYALPQLRELPFVELYGCDSTRGNKTGIITFNVKDVHPHDVSTILDSYGVAIRAGHHCAQPLMRFLGQNATCRASFYLYNTHEDIDQFIAALKKVRGVLGYAD